MVLVVVLLVIVSEVFLIKRFIKLRCENCYGFVILNVESQPSRSDFYTVGLMFREWAVCLCSVKESFTERGEQEDMKASADMLTFLSVRLL